MNLFGLKVVKGDIDGFLGLFVDNLSVFLLIITLNIYVVGLPADIVFGRILPGAAVGLLFGNFYYAYLAKRISKKTGRTDITALPSGISIVFAIAYTFGILLPVAKITGNPEMAWIIGLAANVIGSLICLVGAFIAPWLRNFLPSSAMLGALAGVGIMFIAGMGLDDIFTNPYVGFPALAIIVWGFMARGKLPFRLPAGLLALLLGSVIAISMGQTAVSFSDVELQAPVPWIFKLGIQAFTDSFAYLSLIIPIAVINFVGTLNNVESAETAGDTYPVKEVLLADASASLLGAAFGCCYPNNVFIGHPGYKRMGATQSYGAMAGLFLAIFAICGLFGFLSKAVPFAALTPILIFVGLIMTEVAFTEVKKEHVAASAIAILPFIAEFAKEQIDMALNAVNVTKTADVLESLNKAVNYEGLSYLSYGTVIISMFLAAIVAFTISKELKKAALVAFTASASSFVGLIHSPNLTIGGTPALTTAWALLGGLAIATHFYQQHQSADEKNTLAEEKAG